MLNLLTTLYLQPHRRYHTLDHIVNMFNTAKELGLELDQPQVTAIWFHDAVYEIEPGEKSNEENSAELAETTLTLHGYAPKYVDIVVRCIRATELALKPGTTYLDEDEWSVVGLDLYSFASPNYWTIRELIYEEFSSVPAEKFKEGRRKFLKMMLDKEYIIGEPFFHSAYRSENDGGIAFEEWHEAAWLNIEDELDRFHADSDEG